jgi:hypothetical protein
MGKLVVAQPISTGTCIVGPFDEIQIALVLALLGGAVGLSGGSPGRPSGPRHAPVAEPAPPLALRSGVDVGVARGQRDQPGRRPRQHNLRDDA